MWSAGGALALADNDNSGILCIIMDDALLPACVHVLAYILTSQAQRARRACTVHHVPPDPGQAETRGGGGGGRGRERERAGGREGGEERLRESSERE